MLQRSVYRRSAAAVVAAGLLISAMPTSVDADHSFHTPSAAYVTLTGPGTVTGIISSGETYHDFLFEGLPDGIGAVSGDAPGTVDVYVAHEQTTVPFFGTSDFIDATVDRITIDTTTGAVIDAQVVVGAENGYLRFCSASIAGPEHGFSEPVFFANEETNDVVDVPAGAPYGPDPSLAPQRQGGFTVIVNTETDEFTQVPGMGRHNHENTVAVPGYNQIVLLSGDDTFNAPSSQVYMYLANNEDHVWEDKGSLWAFRVTRKNGVAVDSSDPFNWANDYLDIGVDDEMQGEFIRVPKKIARGETGEAPQAALENWSNANNVFQFIRVEDIAVDKNDPSIVYFADTGRSRVVPDPLTGRLVRGPSGTVGFADNGRMFQFVMNDKNPRKVDSFTVLADGDAPAAHPKAVPMVAPDNIETSANSLMVQEDNDNAKIWRRDFGSGDWSVAATVNDPDGESSGIVDASEWFGPGSWLLSVQAHGTFIEQEQVGPTLLKREDGQLLLMTIPGS